MFSERMVFIVLQRRFSGDRATAASCGRQRACAGPLLTQPPEQFHFEIAPTLEMLTCGRQNPACPHVVTRVFLKIPAEQPLIS